MKYPLILAGLLSLCSASSHALTTTLYGRINTSIEWIKAGNQPTDLTQRSNSSRFGLKGEEIITPDLTVEFQLEHGLNAAGGGSGGLASRDTFVGVKTEYGNIRIGQFDSPAYTLFSASVAKFHDTGLASYAQSPGSSISALGDLGSRLPNAFIYRTPPWGQLAAAFLISDGKINSPARKIVDSAVFYGASTSPVTGGVGFRTYQEAVTTKQNTLFIAAVRYKHQNLFDIAAAYEHGDYASTNIQSDKLFISTQYNFKKAALVASAGIADNIKLNGVKQAGTGAYQATLGMQYELSNRTQLYMYFTKLSNQRAAGYQFLTQPSSGQTNQGWVFGLRHNF